MKVSIEAPEETPGPPARKYKPNYRCIIPNSANVKSPNCDDFFLPYKELEAPGFVCPHCGSTKLMPLF